MQARCIPCLLTCDGRRSIDQRHPECLRYEQTFEFQTGSIDGRKETASANPEPLTVYWQPGCTDVFGPRNS
jgi:hypothetical protein